MKKNNILRLRLDTPLLNKLKLAQEKMQSCGLEINQSQLIRHSIKDICNKILSSKRVKLVFEE